MDTDADTEQQDEGEYDDEEKKEIDGGEEGGEGGHVASSDDQQDDPSQHLKQDSAPPSGDEVADQDGEGQASGSANQQDPASRSPVPPQGGGEEEGDTPWHLIRFEEIKQRLRLQHAQAENMLNYLSEQHMKSGVDDVKSEHALKRGEDGY